MSEGDPDDERDDEQRHDQAAPTGSDEESTDDPDGDLPGEAAENPESDDSRDASAADDAPIAESDSADDDSQGDEAEDSPPADEDDGTADESATGDSGAADGTDVGSVGAATPEPAEPEPAAQTGAPDDQEMPLTQHIEEMIRRLLVVIVVMALVSAVVFPFADRLINFLWYSFLPGEPTACVEQATAAADAIGQSGTGGAASSDSACPRLYHPLALVLARLKVASLSGFIIALPVFVYETYLFMRPGLYPNERRYYLASVPTSLILAGIGVLFAYALVLPLIFTYFLGYSQPVADVAFGLSETFGLILLMLGMFAAIFQIPLFIMLAIMMGVTSRRWLEDRRLYFWFGFAGVAFLFSPDPTGMAPFIVALTMVVLFEGTLLLLRWAGR
ncbi:twin-arginine translocase subunit TatC [Salinibaculum rarum]|uniref:twin-arginine translocase subunit TatC n=1 Tax=Salinibaculum rarum TaxID=3058903 RepID=UPI00265F4C41|nr:twin-arginine translocase subunit TatC [Salinibaculum sp. KK48]